MRISVYLSPETYARPYLEEPKEAATGPETYESEVLAHLGLVAACFWFWGNTDL